jgi:hypothetical protein
VYLCAVPLAIVPATLLIVGCGSVLAARLPLDGATERIAAALLLTLAGVVSTLLIAGVVLQTLDPLVIVVLAALAFGGSVALPRWQGDTLRARAWPRVRSELRRAARAVAENRAVAVLAIAVLGVLVWRTILALRLPVIEYDGLSYHLVSVDVWLQSGSIGRVPHRIWTDGYPANGEVLTLWLMLFSTSDGLARLSSILPLPLAGVATAGLARELGARRPLAVLAGLIVMTLPIVIVKSDSTYVDNLVMALIAAAWFFGVRGMREERPARRRALYFLAGVGIGLAAGTKLSGVLPIALFGVVMVATSVLKHRLANPRAALVEIFAVGGAAVLLGAYWYVQNILVHGNPVYPFSFGPFEGRGSILELLAQRPPEVAGLSHWAQVVASWLADLDATSYRSDIRVGGYGLVWPLLLVLGAFGILILIRRRQYLPIVAAVIPAILGLAATPLPFWLRYTLFVPVIVAALAALSLTRAPRFRTVMTAGVVVLCLASLAIAHRTANFYPGGGESRPGILGLIRLVAADEAERRNLVFWRACSRFEVMPLDARVRTDGFGLLHLIAGPGVDRLLMLPLGANSDPAAALEVGGVRATHLALQDPENIAAAKAAPATFEWLGPVCRGVELFAVRT